MTRVYIGWDPRGADAYEVCRYTLLKHASIPVEVIPLKDWELRAKGVYWRDYYVDPSGQMWDRRDDRPFSTNFSYTRFAIPLLEVFGTEPVVFCDGDMLWRADIAELMELAGDAPLACVKHDYKPDEGKKMTGNIQRRYARKNWSSLMVMRPSACNVLTPYQVNMASHDWLHSLCWMQDEDIVGLPEAWNWLEGWSDPKIKPKVVHFTRGIPSLPGYENIMHAGEWRAALRETKVGDSPSLTAA